MSVRKRYIKTTLRVLLSALVLAGVVVVAASLTAAVVVVGNVHDETVVQILGYVFSLIIGYAAFSVLFRIWERN